MGGVDNNDAAQKLKLLGSKEFLEINKIVLIGEKY